ncbi:MAG: alpha-amylase [Acidobacteria bacterium]|jgi:glycosidase|nr:alpha-amylase [Acidobacteriota bacterium]
MGRHDTAVRQFHVSRTARDRYRFDDLLFALSGNVVFADFHAARVFAQRMNERRDLLRFPERAVSAAQINALGLIDEVLHLLVAAYRQSVRPRVMTDALAFLEARFGRPRIDAVLAAFVDQFPPLEVYLGRQSVDEYLAGATGDTLNREVALEELLLLWLANLNPAFTPFLELFDDARLEAATEYRSCMAALEEFFASQPPLGSGLGSLLQALRSPALASPHSLEGQLEFIRRRWGAILGPALERLLSSLDFLAEERKMFFGFGPGPALPPDLSTLENDIEAYSADLDWMPRVVLLAKNVYVWLEQLSRSFARPVTSLAEVPDEELDRLARWGVTGLWLIGVWERSRASRRIKQMMGDEDAVASAYSVADYRVADDLGGEAAFDNLRSRAWQRGIRLSTDMVPNHVGIDSRWVIEHPDWFISLPYSPFPAYSFTGPDLSDDGRVGIYLEDHYATRSDAAVVFKRVDHWTGDERFIYHGNDGTSMPWNDTAQLDYRNPEAREAVIRTILHVARRSPIIRFDAAMTLTKQHYHRLWFPEPGTGGDIPSRADFGMTRAAFDQVMPNEFWREVVDRVAIGAPDTLLLAEAFWLLEGYFVRTLGMHRVYNSAFMNMLRDENNAGYRRLIKSTLEFDPQILKRYVNFMSNPDERTAVDQFGKEDKYFGVATLLVTMPGLPMLGHGQVEGFAEKYGMEFRRPRWHEEPDSWLVQRHERQIFPLMRRRHLFAEVDHFRLYDLELPDGGIDENVLAYSNASGNERSLVIYHNRYAETRGWIRTSAATAERLPDGSKRLTRTTLSEALGLTNHDSHYLILRDAAGGLEYLRSCRDLTEHGLYVELEAYDLHVFTDLQEVVDDGSGLLSRLAAELDGRGVPSLEQARKELALASVLEPFRRLMAADTARRLAAAASITHAPEDTERLAGLETELAAFLTAAAAELGSSTDVLPLVRRSRSGLATALGLARPAPRSRSQAPTATAIRDSLGDDPVAWATLLGWLACSPLGELAGTDEPAEVSRSLLDGWLLGRSIVTTLRGLGLDETAAWRTVTAVATLIRTVPILLGELARKDAGHRFLAAALRDSDLQSFLGVNRYQNVLWFNHESFRDLLRHLKAAGTVSILGDGKPHTARRLQRLRAVLADLKRAEKATGYQVQRLLDALSPSASSPPDPGESSPR